MATLTITLPDRLAEQAKEMGLLSEEALIVLFEDAVLRRQRINGLFDDADRLASLDAPAMTSEEVQAVIAEVRAGGRAGRP